MKTRTVTIKISIALFVCSLQPVKTSAQDVDLVYTTETERWIAPKKFLSKTENKDAKTIILFSNETLQDIDGFGGAFNELGWTALTSLPKGEYEKVFQALFSKDGANFSMCRIPLGASDYALSYYSSNDVPEDFVMRDFNIDRDKFILIQYIKEAQKIRPDLKVWASPWSPPAWMKVNEHYSLKSGDFQNAKGGNRMTPGAQILNHATAFKMQERYLKSYALYFSKFVSAYEAEGVPLFAIMPQNEIAWAPNWPSCTWRPEDLAYFIGGYLGPQFEADSLDTEIWLGTINWGNPDYVRTVMNDKNAPKYIEGVGFQWGGGRSIKKIDEEYPELKLMNTENKCGENENDWAAFERSWGDMVHYFNSGAGSYMYWNMVLDETGKSAWGWPQNSMVIVDREAQKVIYNDEFYLFKHFSHFIQPGDKVLKSSEGADHLAFKRKDGSLVLIIYNREETAQATSIKVEDKSLNLNLAARSISTLTIADY